MGDKRVELILGEIRKVLASEADFFKLSCEDCGVLADDEHVFSCLIDFEPNTEIDWEETVIVGQKVSLQFDWDGDETLLIVGEDTELGLTRGNLYAALYWSEVSKCSSEQDQQADLADAVMRWWGEHEIDVTGPYGEFNVFHEEPDFVSIARDVLGVGKAEASNG